MSNKEIESIKKVMQYDARMAFEKLIDAEIEAEPRSKYFFRKLSKSKFYQQLYENGFLEGIAWARKHKDTKFVVGG